MKAEFIWLSPEVGDAGTFGGDDGIGGYMPIAVATPAQGDGTTLTYVHGDHLGTPIVMTDATGTQVTQPAGYTTPAFPGQNRTLFDLYYNRYRDYDPTTGRYIQADPIGLEGGASPYSYAMGNPVRYVDPLGQAAFALPAIGGGAGAGGIGAFCASGPWGWVICGGAALGTGFLIWYNWPDDDDIVVPERKFCPPMSMAGGGRRPDGGGARRIPVVVNNNGESDRCVDGWLYETQVYCPKNFKGDAYFGCLDRARDRLLACKREGQWPPSGPRRWTIFDTRSMR